MQAGDILLIQGTNILSKWIQRITGSKWTHAAACLGSGFILEIEWNKKASINRETYINDGYPYAILRPTVPFTNEQKKAFVCRALTYHRTGNQYDWLMILGLFLKTRVPHWKLTQYVIEKNRYVSTELVDQVLKEANVDLFPHREGELYPYDFLQCPKLHIVESSQNMLG